MKVFNNNNRNIQILLIGVSFVGDFNVSIFRFGKEKVDNIGWEGQFMDIFEVDQVEDGAAIQVLKVEAINRQFVRYYFSVVSIVFYDSNGGFIGIEMGEYLEVDYFRYRLVVVFYIYL